MTLPLGEELKKRGLLFQFSASKIEEITDLSPGVLYLGFDPSADSLHVGNLVPYMIVRHFVNKGWRAILLVGGATGMIGDPSFKDAERSLLDEETIAHNVKKIEAQVRSILGDADITLVNNSKWLGKLSMIEFLRDVGKHFTINAMLQKETVKKRIEDPDKSISYTEFSYPLLQAYDFFHLHDKENCTLQIGGSDQWGNITAGIDFIRRKTGISVNGITAPVVVDQSSGKKFGKSEGNAVWLDPEKTSPYKFYQFWLNSSDEAISQYFRIFSAESIENIEKIEREFGNNKSARGAQKALAKEMTILIHGEEEAEKVEKVTKILFGEGSIMDLSKEEIRLLREEIPGGKISKKEMEDISAEELLVTSTLAESNNEARRLLSEDKCIQINSRPVDADFKARDEDFVHDTLLIKKGKKVFGFISRV